nr:uncharacterized protein LOC109190495 [Ipomoea trifida]
MWWSYQPFEEVPLRIIDQKEEVLRSRHSSSPPRAADKYGDDKQEDSDPEVLVIDAAESEFRLDRPDIMLLADELFFDGKLLSLQLPTIRLPATSTCEAAGCPWSSLRCRLPEKNKKR